MTMETLIWKIWKDMGNILEIPSGNGGNIKPSTWIHMAATIYAFGFEN